MQNHEHPQRSGRHQYRYLFTTKHHGGDAKAAQWLPDLPESDEFAVFDGADRWELVDEDGNLYGVLPDGEESLRVLGTRLEQIAKFPFAADETPWHGYPCWALRKEDDTSNRRTQRNQPAGEVFGKMVQNGLISSPMRKRLMKGKHI